MTPTLLLLGWAAQAPKGSRGRTSRSTLTGRCERASARCSPPEQRLGCIRALGRASPSASNQIRQGVTSHTMLQQIQVKWRSWREKRRQYQLQRALYKTEDTGAPVAAAL